MKRHRWSHGHSIGTGALGMLFLESYRAWLLGAFIAVAFFTLGYAVANGRKLLHWSRDMVAVWKLRKGDVQRERLAALDRRGFPRGY